MRRSWSSMNLVWPLLVRSRLKRVCVQVLASPLQPSGGEPKHQ